MYMSGHKNTRLKIMETNNTTTEVLQSEKLTTLNQELNQLVDMPQTFERLSKDWHDANRAVAKKYLEIDAEMSAIRKEQAAAKTAEIRSAKVAEANELIDAVVAGGDREALVNRIVNGSSVSAKKSDSGDGTAKPAGERGATSARILAALQANMAAGMSLTDAKKAVIESGESRGTTGAVATANFNVDGSAK